MTDSLNLPPIRIMIDMETPATNLTTAPISLGAVQFCLPFGIARPQFYERASLESIEKYGFAIDKSTMDWWDKQDAAIRTEAFGGTQSITQLLENFHSWCTLNFGYASGVADTSNIELWSRGAGFDCEILKHCFYELFGNYPFDFRKHMCQRTIERLMPAELVSLCGKNTGKHNALSDAIFQADVMDVALRNIRWNGR